MKTSLLIILLLCYVSVGKSEIVVEIKTKEQVIQERLEKYFSSLDGIPDKELSFLKKYAHLALYHMYENGVLSSVKMAQAILESNHGKSYLFRNHNNNFGIKSFNKSERRVMRADDRPDDHFKVYDSVEESWDDHSKFILNEKSRRNWRELVQYKDAQTWCVGLKEKGYATDPNYPRILMKIINRYNLLELDNIVFEIYFLFQKYETIRQNASIDTGIQNSQSHWRSS